MTLLEPAVALTDLGLAVETAAFAALLVRRREAAPARRWWVLFFTGLALAALLGFVAHGFLADKTRPLHQWIWSASLLAIGVVALAATALAAGLALDARRARAVVRFAVLLLAIYATVVLAGYRRFGLAVTAYSPAILFLLAAFVSRWRRDPARHWRLGIAGLALTAVAAAVQQLGIGLHPVHFNHNALYHLLQALALWLLYLTARASLHAGTRT